jgi:superfamily I DNA/RNA helicase
MSADATKIPYSLALREHQELFNYRYPEIALLLEDLYRRTDTGYLEIRAQAITNFLMLSNLFEEFMCGNRSNEDHRSMIQKLYENLNKYQHHPDTLSHSELAADVLNLYQYYHYLPTLDIPYCNEQI